MIDARPRSLLFLSTLALVSTGLATVAGCGSFAKGPVEVPSLAPSCDLASPEIYRVVAQSDQFRVIEANWEPGQRDSWHSHPPVAVCFLTPVVGRLHSQDGSSKEVRGTAGEVLLPGLVEIHSFENLGSAGARAILVERAAPGNEPDHPLDPAAPPVVASPGVYQELAEDAHFRVLLGVWRPGQRDEWHCHSSHAAIFLTDVRGRIHFPDGASREVRGTAGGVGLGGVVRAHSFENTGLAECRVIIVEAGPPAK